MPSNSNSTPQTTFVKPQNHIHPKIISMLKVKHSFSSNEIFNLVAYIHIITIYRLLEKKHPVKIEV